MTTEEKFNAAVNVIRSLPKNGSYQPSNELMLRFYAYFKQATLGPCTGSRPGFLSFVSRAKYDAWKNLGNMSKGEAMAKYVNELHSIVETMSYSEKVANFLEAPTTELDKINIDDLELIAGDIINKIRSQPDSPLTSREGSPIKFLSSICSSRSVSPTEELDHSDDEYSDTIENLENRRPIANGYLPNHQNTELTRNFNRETAMIDISADISKTLQSLRNDIDRLNNQVSVLEVSNKTVTKRKFHLFDMQPKLIIFLFIWPFLAQFIMYRFISKRK